ncbi:MAG TPA: hypothetical protein VJH97_07350 [Candidatus Nanoarchaeia archaeon]|nr:hypothetical protein [Candidatus Nanoarchaeia archaeon]
MVFKQRKGGLEMILAGILAATLTAGREANAYTVTQLTQNGCANWSPAYSPDGDNIVFASSRDGNSEIYVMDANGNNQRRLTHTDEFNEYSPVFSPDGQKIAYTRQPTNSLTNGGLYTMDSANGDNITLLVVGRLYSPSWSHDGNKIAYAISLDMSSAIYFFNLKTSNSEYVVMGNNPSWSSDGTNLTYARWLDNTTPIHSFIYNLNLLTGNEQLLVEGSLPNWDYRKDKIIFNDTNGFICVIDHNGSNITQIVRNSTNSIPAVPKWGPDGTKAVFMGRDITQMGSNNIIYVVSGILRRPEINRLRVDSSTAIIDAKVSPESFISIEYAGNIYFTNSVVTNFGLMPNFGQGFAANQFVVHVPTNSDSQFYRLIAEVTNQPTNIPSDNPIGINAPNLKQEKQPFYKSLPRYREKKDALFRSEGFVPFVR